MLFKKKLSASILLILCIVCIQLVFVNAVSLNDTILNTSISNLTINFSGVKYYTSQVDINSDSIYFDNFTRTQVNEYITFNISSSDKLYHGNDLSYFNSSTDTLKSIKSNINVTATFHVNISYPCSKLGIIKYSTPNLNETTWTSKAARNLCSNSFITLTRTLNAGDSYITISDKAALGDTCSGFFDAGVSFNQFVIILIIVSISGILLLFMKSEDTDMGQIIFISGMIIVGAIVMVIGMIIINTMSGC